MKIKKFNESFDDMTFSEAFDNHIKGQVVSGRYSDRPLCKRGDNFEPYYAYVDGVRFDNGWSYANHGGGCSGEDCNTTFIISPDNKVVSLEEW
jgi:hypothetical protein